jgi:uncharacterized membrane protein YcaP (DUF421 family)
MFNLTEPWWQLVARAAIVYVVLMILVRLSGKRTVGEFTPFDLVVVLLIAEASQGALTGGDESVQGGLLLAVTLIAINYGVGFLSARSKRFDSLVEGEPVVLVRNGDRDDGALRRNNVPLSDLDEAIRKAGFLRQHDVRLALLETDGAITIVPRRTKPPEQ